VGGSGSVQLAARFEGPLGGSSVDVEAGLQPGEDVAHLGLAAAGGQVVDLAHRQLAVPHVEVGQVADERLRGVEAPAVRVLRGRNGVKKIASIQKGQPRVGQ